MDDRFTFPPKEVIKSLLKTPPYWLSPIGLAWDVITIFQIFGRQSVAKTDLFRWGIQKRENKKTLCSVKQSAFNP